MKPSCKRLFIVSVLMIFFGEVSCNCQCNLKLSKQRHFYYSNKNYLDSLNIKYPDFKEINCELRIWYSKLITGQNKFFQIKMMKDSSWVCNAIEFYYYNSSSHNFKETKAEKIKLKDEWYTIWSKIVQNDYLNLTTQRDDKIKTSDNEVLLIGDGEVYTFEILTKKIKRNFSYSNPYDYYKYYLNKGIKVAEYESITSFIDLLKEVLNFE